MKGDSRFRATSAGFEGERLQILGSLCMTAIVPKLPEWHDGLTQEETTCCPRIWNG